MTNYTNPSQNPDYGKLQRRYRKAADALVAALDFLSRTARDEDDYTTLDAMVMVERAMKRLNAEEKAERQRLGVGVYSPYGAKGRRR